MIELVRKALRDRVVASQRLPDGCKVFAYPGPTGVLIGVGYDADLAQRVQPEALLRKRSADLQRFGTWLPALFTDGSCYVVRRLGWFDPASDEPIISDTELQLARELLS